MPEDLRGIIVEAMMNLDAPTNLYRIMKATGLPPGTVDYWLDKLEKEGVVVADVSREQKGYVLQPIFYSEDFAKNFDKGLSKLYGLVEKNLMLPTSKIDKEKASFATLLTILHVINQKHRYVAD